MGEILKSQEFVKYSITLFLCFEPDLSEFFINGEQYRDSDLPDILLISTSYN